MTNAIIPMSTLADNLKTAVKSEEPDQITTAVQAIATQQAEQAVVAELGQKLTARGVTNAEQTIIAYALDAIEHPDTIDHLGKFLLNTKHEFRLRSTVLGFLQNRVHIHPTKTLSYLRQLLDRTDPAFRERLPATFEYAITNIIVPEADSSVANFDRKQILLDAGIKSKHLQTALFKELDKLDATPIPIPSIFAEALGLLGDQEAIDLLCQLLSQHQQAQLDEEQRAGRNGRTAENQLDLGPIRERVMLAAVDALRTTKSEAAVNCLANTLVKNLNYKVQRHAADALGKLGFKSCIPHLLSALFVESNQPLKEKISKSLSEIGNWQEKASQLVVQLTQMPVQRGQLDAKSLLTAVQPSQEEQAQNPHLLTDFLIEAAIQRFNDERLLQIFADLIKASTNNKSTLIRERLELYQENEKVSEEVLNELRIEIGGKETLKPLTDRLEKNLLKFFQEPIDKLNTETQTVWQRTIFLANLGFILRISLNLAIFAIGAYFMIDSYGRIVNNELTTQQLTTLMAVFIGGGATMFATFFTFPLKQIKRAVTDVGLANVAFISYIHGVLQISHTFSYFYLNGDITFDEIELAAKQIEETSHEAILTLSIAGSEGDQTQFDKALLDRISGLNKPPETANPSSTPPTNSG
ncbi:HEAT repeat domain-containing protein [Candidatus Leptofilum sp.]|uniref:HEAT repeat domain-containing protein n=1 Tax=Candidatus Leptofilum sp. TaxID=3241576 RepID=UPI003B59A2C9